MPQTQPAADSDSTRASLRRRDQTAWLAMVVSGLVMSWSYWLVHGGHRGELIEIDRAQPLHARYLVDINQADWPEIIQLPGLGETLARRVLADRRANGPFRDIDDVARVSGIGPRTLEKIRPYLIPIPKDTDWAAADRPDNAPVQ